MTCCGLLRPSVRPSVCATQCRCRATRATRRDTAPRMSILTMLRRRFSPFSVHLCVYPAEPAYARSEGISHALPYLSFRLAFRPRAALHGRPRQATARQATARRKIGRDSARQVARTAPVHAEALHGGPGHAVPRRRVLAASWPCPGDRPTAYRPPVKPGLRPALRHVVAAPQDTRCRTPASKSTPTPRTGFVAGLAVGGWLRVARCCCRPDFWAGGTRQGQQQQHRAS